MSIGLIHLISDVHNEGYIDTTLDIFLKEIEEGLGESFKRVSCSHIIKDDFTVIFIKSGGVENRFKEIYESLSEPYILLSSGMHNSFAASLEILSFLKQRGRKAEIVHGSSSYIAGRLKELEKIFAVRKRLRSTKLGVIGKPSDWLISSEADYKRVKELSGVEIVDIKMEELIEEVERVHDYKHPRLDEIRGKGFDNKAVDGALKIYSGIKAIAERYNLHGVTTRCFDLLGKYKNTGCLGVALLNDEGYIAGCEGDVPALISMSVLNYLTEQPVFMANPSSIDVDENSVTLAHCTLPLGMANEYTLDTHFESGLGVGVRGIIQEGRGTIFKLSGDLKSYFVSGIDIVENLNSRNLCRTQIVAKLDEKADYFFRNPIGNHHIICRGDFCSLIKEFFRWL